MNDPYKELLTDHIHSKLPDLLRANEGRMDKEEARKIINQEFAATQHGWPPSLDEIEGNQPRHKNAWGHALKRLFHVDGITEPCSGQPDYCLRGVRSRGGHDVTTDIMALEF